MKKVKMQKSVVKDLIFHAATSIGAVLEIHLYALTLANIDWEKIKEFGDYFRCNERTSKEIMNMFIEKDGNGQRPYPQLPVMPGGAWFNSGFSCLGSGHLQDWEVEIPELVMHEAGNYHRREKKETGAAAEI